jgi:hypothetical protein
MLTGGNWQAFVGVVFEQRSRRDNLTETQRCA